MTWAPCPHGVRTRGKNIKPLRSCSLQWVYALEGIANVFNSEAKLGQYLFQGCINLAEVALSELPSPRESAQLSMQSESKPS